MKPYALIVDDFLDQIDLEYVIDYCSTAVFGCTANPKQDIVYENTVEIEDSLSIAKKLSMIMGSEVKTSLLVLRRSSENTRCPQIAHDDVEVYGSQYSMILYLNKPEHCDGGTSLLRHRMTNETDGTKNEEWKNDRNDICAFDVELTCQMKTNRAFIFPSRMIHCSQPLGGFGTTPEDSRVVLVALFDLVRSGDKN